MKTLLLVRHAKSSWGDSNLMDRERPLNKRGKRDAPHMGRILWEKKFYPDLIVTSFADRAFDTAQLIAEQINYPQDKISQSEKLYHASIKDFMSVVKETNDDVNTLMVIGHNPGLTEFVNFISPANISNVPTCGVVCLEFNFDKWDSIINSRGILRFFEYPKKYFS